MHLHGPVPLDDGSYADRPFELQLIREVQAGRWVLLLGPRQHGKTSAFLRLRRNLADHGTSAALVDLQKVPPFERYAQLVTWFAREVGAALKHAVEIAETDDLSMSLRQALPHGTAPIVILVDEASNISNDEWRNSFFGQLRAISSERAAAKNNEIAKRLRLVFTGTFRPERLVAEQNSPFNICERIDTSDLSVDDVTKLAAEAGVSEPGQAAALIYETVGGQPYLNQRLIQAAIGMEDPLAAIRAEADRLREGDNDHINNLFRRVVSEDKLVDVVAQVVAAGSVTNEAGNEDHRYLTVLGVLHRVGGTLVFRNRLYGEVAANSPQFTKVEHDAGQLAPIFALRYDAFSKMTSPELKEIAHRAQLGAVGAYRSGSNRLALAGFGTTMEAVLIEFLKRRSSGDLATAAAECRTTKGPWYSATDPATWTLADLMRGSRKLLGLGAVDIPENLREWRNLIHPGASLANYKLDADLAPEVHAASAQLQIILRDLP